MKSIDSELNEIEVGDLIDIETDYESFKKCRVIELIDDISQHADNTLQDFTGPGCLVELPMGGTFVVTPEQIVSNSKAKYYFGESKKLLLSLLREIVSAQHTVYHTASIYEDDIDEMSAGGSVGAAPYRDLDEDEEDVI